LQDVSRDAEPERQNRCLILTVCGFLLLAVALVFGQAACYEFVDFDDGLYVYENPQVAHGLTAQGLTWAFMRSHAGNWHPLTWVSLMCDCELYGLNAGGHHLTNVLVHAATTILLFLVLWRMTGGFWPGALVAAIFAVHPLHVESVAWVSERKDVLSGLFFVLTLAAYLRYVRRPFSLARYLLVIALFAAGLMAKPMLVTLPFVLLVLDYWPLRRFAGSSWRRFAYLTMEKLPLLLLTALSCVATVWAQGEAVVPLDRLPFCWRLGNALVSYVAYVGQSCCPLGLAVFYPHPGADLPIGKLVASAAILAGVSAAALAGWRRRPYLIVGWLWYLGMLVPVIGLSQTGLQATADRYTYLPQIGLCIALAWGVTGVWPSSTQRRWVCSVASALMLLVLMGCAWRQTTFWCDNETLWNHTLACTSRNNVAQNRLGKALADRGQADAAIAHYRKALEIKPDYAEAHDNLGNVLAGRGQVDLAIAHYRKGLEIQPDDAEAHNNLAVALAGCGQVDSAIAHYRKALEIQPDHIEAHNNLAVALAGRGQVDLAIAHYQKVLELKPGYAKVHNNLGNALAGRGQVDLAITHYQKALEIQPDYAEAHNNLANALTDRGQVDSAVAHYQTALEIKPDYAEAHYNLAVILAGRGQVDSAIAHYQKVLALKPDDAEARQHLAVVVSQREGILKTLAKWRAALRLQPNDVALLNNTAWLLATNPNASVRDGREAVGLAERALKLSGGHEPAILGTLAAAYAEAERFPEAVAAARNALQLARQQNRPALADALQGRISQYELGKPYRETSSASAPPPPKP
jgi:tetratricopeptide (TPR) repeat protein